MVGGHKEGYRAPQRVVNTHIIRVGTDRQKDRADKQQAVPPQTNGKLERFHGSIEAEIFHYKSLPAYVSYYNERRPHFALDIAHRQTPLQAFADKKATKVIRKNNPQWMEVDEGRRR